MALYYSQEICLEDRSTNYCQQFKAIHSSKSREEQWALKENNKVKHANVHTLKSLIDALGYNMG